jgi:hypothetical protein
MIRHKVAMTCRGARRSPGGILRRCWTLLLLQGALGGVFAAGPAKRGGKPDPWAGLDVASRSKLQTLMARFKALPRAELGQRLAVLEDGIRPQGFAG